MSPPTPGRADEPSALDPRLIKFDPGLAGDRTALAWTRSALSLAGNAVLLARAAFVAHQAVAGVVAGLALASVSLLTWRHGLRVYPQRRLPDSGASHHQAVAFRRLAAVTVLTAAVATAVAVTLAVGGY